MTTGTYSLSAMRRACRGCDTDERCHEHAHRSRATRPTRDVVAASAHRPPTPELIIAEIIEAKSAKAISATSSTKAVAPTAKSSDHGPRTRRSAEKTEGRQAI